MNDRVIARRQSIIDEANPILATIREGPIRFEQRNSFLWLIAPHGKSRVSLHPIGDRIDRDKMGLYFGGTMSVVLGQLTRWIRDQTRSSLWCWEYWCSPTVGLGNSETYPMIAASTYGNPMKTACIVCGEPAVKSLDWLTCPEGEGVGPCHLGPRCRKAKASVSL